jgi:hypothetical protein
MTILCRLWAGRVSFPHGLGLLVIDSTRGLCDIDAAPPLRGGFLGRLRAESAFAPNGFERLAGLRDSACR